MNKRKVRRAGRQAGADVPNGQGVLSQATPRYYGGSLQDIQPAARDTPPNGMRHYGQLCGEFTEPTIGQDPWPFVFALQRCFTFGAFQEEITPELLQQAIRVAARYDILNVRMGQFPGVWNIDPNVAGSRADLHAGFTSVTSAFVGAILKAIRTHVVTLATHPVGMVCLRTVLTALASNGLHSALPPVVGVLFAELSGQWRVVAENPRGNVLLQAVVACLHQDEIALVAMELSPAAAHLATNTYGCRVVQALISVGSEEAVAPILEAIVANLQPLVWHRYGNYSVQLALRHEATLRRIFTQLPSLLSMASDKVASNVVETLIKRSPPDIRRQAVRLLLMTPPSPTGEPTSPQATSPSGGGGGGSGAGGGGAGGVGSPAADGQASGGPNKLTGTAVESLLLSPFGNYVVQCALQYSDGELRAEIAQIVAPYVTRLAHLPCRRSLIPHLESALGLPPDSLDGAARREERGEGPWRTSEDFASGSPSADLVLHASLAPASTSTLSRSDIGRDDDGLAALQDTHAMTNVDRLPGRLVADVIALPPDARDQLASLLIGLRALDPPGQRGGDVSASSSPIAGVQHQDFHTGVAAQDPNLNRGRYMEQFPSYGQPQPQHVPHQHQQHLQGGGGGGVASNVLLAQNFGGYMPHISQSVLPNVASGGMPGFHNVGGQSNAMNVGQYGYGGNPQLSHSGNLSANVDGGYHVSAASSSIQMPMQTNPYFQSFQTAPPYNTFVDTMHQSFNTGGYVHVPNVSSNNNSGAFEYPRHHQRHPHHKPFAAHNPPPPRLGISHPPKRSGRGAPRGSDSDLQVPVMSRSTSGEPSLCQTPTAEQQQVRVYSTGSVPQPSAAGDLTVAVPESVSLELQVPSYGSET